MDKPPFRSSRRSFLQKGIWGSLGIGSLWACQPSSKKLPEQVNINFNKKVEWKMVTTWPPNFPIVGDGAIALAERIFQMSGGRLKIHVYGAGELVPAFECFDAVSQGAVEMASGAAYYWAGKIPAAQFFAAVPFGMNAQQMNAWIMSGGGQSIWEQLYAPFDLIPMLGGNTGIQMGGWFNRQINSIDDLKGLKMRMPGLGGKVLTQSGGTAVSVAGGEIYTNLERGVIDATEWIGPYHDYKMGFHQIAEYYYYPGWHEPGTALEYIVNRQKFETLPSDLQEIIRTALQAFNHWCLSEFEAKNNAYLQILLEEEGVQLRRFPEDVLRVFRENTLQVLESMVSEDSTSQGVYDAYLTFQKMSSDWASYSEKLYYQELM